MKSRKSMSGKKLPAMKNINSKINFMVKVASLPKYKSISKIQRPG